MFSVRTAAMLTFLRANSGRTALRDERLATLMMELQRPAESGEDGPRLVRWIAGELTARLPAGATPIVSRALFATVMFVALAGSACATATTSAMRVRASTTVEARLVGAALGPLLVELNEPALHRDGCKIGLGIMPSPRINASTGPGTATPCTTFTLLVTEGALARLPEPMLRAVLAHELGHVALRHNGKNTRANEAAADQFAVALLKRLEPGYPDACVQLVYVFAVLREQGPLAAPWFAAHPSPERRAETALDGCNR